MRHDARHFLLKIGLLALGLSGGLSAILAVFLAMPKDESGHLAALLDRHALLEATPGPRMIFVGGSNLAFGLDSRMVAAATGWNVVNTGLHAGLGLKYMLDDVEPFLRPGDLVVLVPEYDHFVLANALNGEMALAEFLLKYHLRGLRLLDFRQSLNLVRNAPTVVWKTILNEGVRGLRARTIAGNAFHRGVFNEHGDLIGHLSLPNHDVPPEPVLPQDLQPEAIAALNAFARRQQERRVRCVLMSPSLRRLDYVNSEPAIRLVDAALRRELGFPILGTPGDFVFPDDVFFDTGNHLDRIGRAERTRRVIRLLRQSGTLEASARI